MTNKRYDWMTPEEAAKELKPGDYVWVDWNSKIQPGVIEATSFSPFIECVLIEFWHPHHLKKFDRICRAIVPEVPGE